MDTRIKRWTARLSRITSGGNFIPEIDGLRFLAISSVLLFHASYALLHAYHWELGASAEAVSNLFARGALGVELFFVISGFILAVPFARQFAGGGKPVDLRLYYIRRVTRLEPPYIITLVIFYAAAWIFHDAAMQGRLLSTFLVRLFYLHGLVYRDAPALNGVTWSLEIEVQFYLIVPLLARIFCLPPKLRRGIMLLGVLLVPFVPRQGLILFTVISQLALFLAGFLFADLYLEMRQNETAARPAYDWAALGVFTLVLAFPFLMQGAGALHPFAGSGDVDVAMSMLRHILPVLILVFLLLMFRGVWLRRFFSWKPVYLIGGMCYSIYLIHYPLISTASRLLAKILPGMHYLPGLALLIVLWLPIVVGIAAVFFALIERPCMDHAWPGKLMARIKRRF
ncbi:MAG TPA: acyltransferase [Verrucomicrobiae bacterium]|jgi:peptidoglycan/LPS O-acetylase OafA/YrhL|nr:acyltransferase [Verrucomicrobiae bacterium]